jgi:hypothetical protein
LQDIRAILKNKFITTEKIKAFGKVVVIEFADGTHNIELLPAWRLTDGRYKIPNTGQGGSWEVWNPAADIEHIQTSNTQTRCTLNLIRMLKRWKDFESVPLKAFKIELLVVDFLSQQGSPHANNYADLINNFFRYLIDHAHGRVITASGEIIDLHNDWLPKAETAAQHFEEAIELAASGLMKDAVIVLKNYVFGPSFPMLEARHTLLRSEREWIANLSKRYPSVNEVYLERDFSIPISIDGRYETYLDADITQDGFRKGLLSRFLQKHYPLKKRKSLLFKINTTVTKPYNVKWKVRNFGDEAYHASGLRGEISDDNGFLTKKESTLYKGVHYVECYVIKNDTCISIGRIFVPIEVSSME